MSTYNLNIDTVNTSLDFYQAEKYIYGSSRLGMLKDSVNVLGSAYTNTDTSNFVHTLGNKRYELSNHLGNVLTVISDKPIPHNNGGTVDYFMADIKSAYDYSPFGVMLTGRTFEGKETVCHDSTVYAVNYPLQEGFGTWGSWTSVGSALLTYVSDEMQVSNPSNSKKNIGASKTFVTGSGLHNVSFKVIGNTCSNIVIWPPSSTPIPIQVIVRDNANNVVASGNYTTAGTYSLSFTPTSANLNYKIEFYMANANAFCFFRVDDVLVSYEDESVLTVCKEVDGFYPYSFQGQLRDDEIKGKGNSYDFGARMYDSRLGRWLTIDPLASKYPSSSPYVFVGNSPLIFIDPNGKEIIIHYKDENNEDQYYKYGSKIEPPNNSFVTATINALNEISTSPSATCKMYELMTVETRIIISKSEETLTYVATGGFKSGEEMEYFLSGEQSVKFNPSLGLTETSTGVTNPPFISLWHELGHQYNALDNLENFLKRLGNKYDKGDENEKWSTEEEKYNIEQNEWPMIDDKGGFKRETHKVGGNSGVKQDFTREEPKTPEEKRNPVPPSNTETPSETK